MLIRKAYKTQLKPTKKQEEKFSEYSNVARFVYNWALGDRQTCYEWGIPTGYEEQKKRFNCIKHIQYPWTTKVAYRVVESAFRNLDAAYKNFYRRLELYRRGLIEYKDIGFPQFKRRRCSFTLRDTIKIEDARILLPVIGWVSLKEKGYIPTSGVRILSANISEKANHWFVSVQVEEEIKDKVATGPAIGVDLGIKKLATLSDGTTFENPNTLREYEQKQKRLNRELNRRKQGGKNYKKTKIKLARLHDKVTNIRKNALHETSHRVIDKNPSIIVLEDLDIKKMQQSSLAKSVSDASLGELKRQIVYKAGWNGTYILEADRFYASSKICSNKDCRKKKESLKLSERVFRCDDCGLIIDRDLNAAINLERLAAKHAVTACGGERFSPVRCSPRKQESDILYYKS